MVNRKKSRSSGLQRTMSVTTALGRGSADNTSGAALAALPSSSVGSGKQVDGRGTAATTKTVTITTNDGKFGKLRTQVTSRAYGGAPLNVDVQPFVRGGGQILLHLTIEYSQGRNPDADGNPDRIMSVSLNQSAVLLLENGKPLMLSQSADPIGDRKVTVEVKATVLKN